MTIHKVKFRSLRLIQWSMTTRECSLPHPADDEKGITSQQVAVDVRGLPFGSTTDETAWSCWRNLPAVPLDGCGRGRDGDPNPTPAADSLCRVRANLKPSGASHGTCWTAATGRQCPVFRSPCRHLSAVAAGGA